MKGGSWGGSEEGLGREIQNDTFGIENVRGICAGISAISFLPLNKTRPCGRNIKGDGRFTQIVRVKLTKNFQCQNPPPLPLPSRQIARMAFPPSNQNSSVADIPEIDRFKA